MSLNTIDCRQCGQTTPHGHFHDAAHGIEGTHMAGSERFTCNVCGNSIFVSEAKDRGFGHLFILDKVQRGTP